MALRCVGVLRVESCDFCVSGFAGWSSAFGIDLDMPTKNKKSEKIINL